MNPSDSCIKERKFIDSHLTYCLVWGTQATREMPNMFPLYKKEA